MDRPDTLRVRSASAGGTWEAEIDLATGRRTYRRFREEPVHSVLSEERLAELRAAARRVHAGGDQSSRAQFADGEETFVITLDGRSVTVHDEGFGNFIGDLDVLHRAARA